MALGFVIQAISGLWMMTIHLDVGWGVWSADAFLQNLAAGIILDPVGHDYLLDPATRTPT